MEKLRAERSYNVANVTKQCLFSGEKTRPAKGSSRLLSKKSNLVERISISTQSKRIWNHTKPSVRTYAFTKPGHAVMFCFVGEARERVKRMSGQSSKRALAKDKWGTEPGGGYPKDVRLWLQPVSLRLGAGYCGDSERDWHQAIRMVASSSTSQFVTSGSHSTLLCLSFSSCKTKFGILCPHEVGSILMI